MPHLPNEIWLLIIAYCEPRDLWLTLRTVNSQLQLCVEQYFKHEILPDTTLMLPVIIPTYDVRTPVRGLVKFKPLKQHSSVDVGSHFRYATCCLSNTDPGYYRPHFLSRWTTMQDPVTARLDEQRFRWDLELGGRKLAVGLRDPIAVQACKSGEARMLFDWRYMVTSFFKAW